MALDVWPVGLPQKLLMEGNSYQIGDGRLRTQPSAGVSIDRQRFTAVVDLLSGSMLMTDAQIATMTTFIKTTLLGGSLPFTFPDQFNSPATITVKFSTMPRFGAVSGTKRNIDFAFEVLP